MSVDVAIETTDAVFDLDLDSVIGSADQRELRMDVTYQCETPKCGSPSWLTGTCAWSCNGLTGKPCAC